MGDKVRYYELVEREIDVQPDQIMTAAMWYCALCRDTIFGMGGPGDGELCKRCGDAIKTGEYHLEKADG